MKLSHRRSTMLGLLGLLSVFLLGFVSNASAISNGQAASLVIGQSSFITNNIATTSTELNLPYGLVFDSGGNLWVADLNNNRVLEYTSPFSTHEAASLVIGQSSFTSSASATTSTGLNNPQGLAFDSGGNLWVVDQLNSRVLKYTTPFSTNEAASLVIGQSSFTTSDFATTNSTSLSYPTGLAFDSSGNLWVADQANNRVLEYTMPFSTHEAASLVIGQSSFTTSNFPITAKGLNGANAVAFDTKGNLWVSDFRHDRVMEYTTPFSTHEAASLVIGQSSFTACDSCFTGSGPATSSTVLFNPTNLKFDSGGNLWVVDGSFNRVLEYNAPFITDEAASIVIGQSDFTSNTAATTSRGLSGPYGLAFDSSGYLWVADTANSRVLQYGSSSAATTSTSTGTSTSSPTTSASTTTSSTPSTFTSSTPSSTTSSSTASRTTGGGGGIPEFPFQPLTAAVLTALIVTSYLLIRRNVSRRLI
ncbi:MAG: NHL repeat-containing protein [Thaumarchaeota archaeon]|nr:NHL repeat-containing protein [Nitrososphaerota archaeon]